MVKVVAGNFGEGAGKNKAEREGRQGESERAREKCMIEHGQWQVCGSVCGIGRKRQTDVRCEGKRVGSRGK